MTTDLAVQWALSSRSSDPAQAVRRLSAVRSFARYRAAFDSATEIPPTGLLGRLPRRKPPHIYSPAEIAAVLQQAHGLLPHRGLRPQTYVALFSLLASTGLRLSEAGHLMPRDVDLASGNARSERAGGGGRTVRERGVIVASGFILFCVYLWRKATRVPAGEGE